MRPQARERPRRDDALDRDAEALGPRRALVDQPQLTGRVRVGVDREQASALQCQRDEVVGRVLALRPGVDLDSDPVRGARIEHGAGIERRRRARAPRAGDEAPRDVAEHIHLTAGDRRHEPACHRRRLHPQLRVRRRHDDVERLEQLRLVVELAAVEDVDLDSAQQGEAVVGVCRDLLQLRPQPLRREPVRHPQPW